jgi:hypothetical protein
LFCAAQTFGNASANNTIREVTSNIFITREKKKFDCVSIHSFTRKLQMMMIAIFMTIFASKRDARSDRGSSSNFNILFAAGNCFVLSRLISLNERENNATSAPDTIKDISNKNSRIKTSTVVAA